MNRVIDNICNKFETEYYYYAPPEGGIKIGGHPFTQYYMTEIHIQNNHGEIGKVLSQTMRIWHTSHLRKNDLDTFTIGLSVGNLYSGLGLMIPPREPRFVIRSVVDMNCFKDVIIVKI